MSSPSGQLLNCVFRALNNCPSPSQGLSNHLRCPSTVNPPPILRTRSDTFHIYYGAINAHLIPPVNSKLATIDSHPSWNKNSKPSIVNDASDSVKDYS
jgi:hypothetical protein